LKMNKDSQRGFHLVEVLVSILILSIGVLCAAGMQLTAMQTAQHSGRQAIALQLAIDMANQIRTNGSSDKLKDEQNPYLSMNYESGSQLIPPSVQCLSVKENCSSKEVANFSIYEWERKINENLPQGRVLVCRDIDPWDPRASRYRWDCNSASSGSGSLVIKLGWQEKKTNEGKPNVGDKNTPPLIALVVGI
jgi:type IV pilus assembly protein PilV